MNPTWVLVAGIYRNKLYDAIHGVTNILDNYKEC
jgi:hypothetical protein